MRILMTVPVPLLRELGVARVPADLAVELRDLGHVVEIFDSTAAFGPNRASRLQRLQPLRFAARARDYVRAHAQRFDVVEGTQGDLPFPKEELRFDGLLVARSPGLFSVFDAYDAMARARWPEHRRGTPVGRAAQKWAWRRMVAAYRRSLEVADLVNVPNEAEHAYVRDVLGRGERALLMPLGLRDVDAAALSAAAGPPAQRLAAPHVAFVGSWSLRKGLADWPEIVARTRALLPDVRFSFLGTVDSPEDILGELGVPGAPWITVVPHFRSEELPALLGSATVGALPSYAEAWGLGVLEQLAAGMPVVAYDIPGPRDMLSRLDPTLLVPCGDAGAFAERLVEVLQLEPPAYGALSQRSRGLAAEFRWSEIAAKTAAVYASALEELKASRSPM